MMKVVLSLIVILYAIMQHKGQSSTCFTISNCIMRWKVYGGRHEGVLLWSGLIHVSVTQHISSLLSLTKWWNVGILLQMKWAFTNAHLSRVGLLKDLSLSLTRCFSRLSCTPLPLPWVLFVLMSHLFPMHFWILCIQLKTLVPALDCLYIITFLLTLNYMHWLIHVGISNIRYTENTIKLSKNLVQSTS